MFKVTLFGSILLVLLFTTANATSGNETSCNSHSATLFQCSETQMCDETTGKCICMTGFEPHDKNECVKKKASEATQPSSLVDDNTGGSIAGYILIPLCLISLVIFGVFLGRKYKLAGWFRSKIQQRNSNYDEFMIGQDDDDPPLC